MFALAAEAGAAVGKFWVLTRELLLMRHDDPASLHDALVRAGVDPDRALDSMRAGTGADRVVDDVASAHASGVGAPPALFINGEYYRGELEPGAVMRALDQSRNHSSGRAKE